MGTKQELIEVVPAAAGACINHRPTCNENTVSFAAELLITFPQKLTHDAETHKFLLFSPHKGAVPYDITLNRLGAPDTAVAA